MLYSQALKEKYPDAKQAYMAYHLQKHFKLLIVASENAPKQVKEAVKVAEVINEFIDQSIKDYDKNLPSIDTIEKITKTKDGLKYIKKNAFHMDFLGLTADDFSALLSGMYARRLRESAQSITWEKLEKVIEEEKLDIELLETDIAKKDMLEVSRKFNLSSIIIPYSRLNKEIIQNIDKSCHQLSLVIGCDKTQIGLNRISITIDNQETIAAGMSSDNFDYNSTIQTLYVKSQLSYAAFAHEWLHCIDRVWGQNLQEKDDYASNSDGTIGELLEKSKNKYNATILHLKQMILKETERNCINIIKRFDNIGSISEPSILESVILENINKIKQGVDINKKELIEFIETLQTDVSYGALPSYLLTELDLLQKIKNDDMDQSLFFEYAKTMDANLKDLEIIEEDYSTTNVEMFARMFETYSTMKLQELGVQDNVISVVNCFFTPSELETQEYRVQWNKVTDEMKQILEKVSPTQNKQEALLSIGNNIANKMKNIQGLYQEKSSNEQLRFN